MDLRRSNRHTFWSQVTRWSQWMQRFLLWFSECRSETDRDHDGAFRIGVTIQTAHKIRMPSSPLCSYPTTFSWIGTPLLDEIKAPNEMVLVLAANKESMLFDPVDFAKFLQHIKVWANHSELLVIPPKTEALFCERELPHHSPRALQTWHSNPIPAFSISMSPHHKSCRLSRRVSYSHRQSPVS